MRLRIGLAAIVGAAALSFAVPAFGQVSNFSLQLTGVEGVVYPESDAYAGFYYGTINAGPTTTMICDDYFTDIPLPYSWTATALAAPAIQANLGSTKFGNSLAPNALTDYAEIATLVELMFVPTETAAQRADISGAIWSIADQGKGPLPLDAGSSEDILWAENYVGSNAAGVLAADTNLTLYTPSPLSASQEFWVDPKETTTVPEGGAALLYLLLAGAACFGAMVLSPRKRFGSRASA